MRSPSSGSANDQCPEAQRPGWLDELCQAITSGECIDLTHPSPWGTRVALVLAPHPDDPEAIAVTLRLLASHGWQLYWAIVTSGWSGVLDEFVGADRAAKAAVRRSEQEAAAGSFGLPRDRLAFLDLEESETGSLADTPSNRQRLRGFLNGLRPELALLPTGLDSNATHRRVYQWFAEWAASSAAPVVALGNEDPKSLEFHPHGRVVFDRENATWKAGLLEHHKSQSARNLAQRGHTLAERILRMNRAAAGNGGGEYAERFQAACWGLKAALI